MKPQERNTITSFLQRWAQVKGHALDPLDIEFPEDHLSTLDDQERRHPIDAKVDSLKIALEHTSCDALTGQRHYDALFREVCTPIEDELKGKAQHAVLIIIPYEAVTEEDWRRKGRTLKEWLIKHFDDIDVLPVGRHLLSIPKFPYDVVVTLRDSSSPAVRCGRSLKEDSSFDHRLYKKAGEKIDKLLPHKGQGYRLILLIENADLALMNADKIHSSIQRNSPLFNKVDEVWHVDSSLSREPEYFHFDGRRMLRVTSKDKECVSF